jgi:MoxR-like ATPase
MAKGSKDKSMHDVVIISSLEIPKYVNLARAKNKVIALFGGPGIGKTSGIKEAARQMADDMGLKFVEQPTPEDWKDRSNFCYRIILSTYLNEEDTNGIPFKYTMADGKEVTRYLPTELFPEDGIGMIVFDEYANGRNGVMQALQQMILEHTAGNIKISKDIQFVVASNRPSDNTGCNEVPDATKNRLMWCEV